MADMIRCEGCGKPTSSDDILEDRDGTLYDLCVECQDAPRPVP